MKKLSIKPRLVTWIGFVFCVMAFVSTAVFFVTIITKGMRGDPVMLFGNMIFAVVGVVVMFLGECLKNFDDRIIQLENSKS